MGTNTPVVREHDFPITEPYKPPLRLPAPDPSRYIPITPVRQPEKVPVRVRGDDGTDI